MRLTLAFGASLALLALIGPDVARDSWPRPPVTMLVGMQPGQDLLIAREASPAITVGRGGMSYSRYRVLLEQSGSQMDVVQASAPFALLSAWDFVSRRQLVVYAPAEVARSAGFIHLVIEEEQRAPNHPAGRPGRLLGGPRTVEVSGIGRIFVVATADSPGRPPELRGNMAES